MDAHIFRRFCDELAPMLIGARVEKLFELSESIFIITLFGNFIPNKSVKRYLIIKIHKKNPFIFLSSQKVSSGIHPSAKVMRFRKYMQNKHLVEVQSDWLNRTLYLRQVDNTILEINLSEGLKLRSEIPVIRTDFLEKEELQALYIQLQSEDQEIWKEYPIYTPPLRNLLKYLSLEDYLDLMLDLQLGGGDLFLYSKNDIQQLSAYPLKHLLAKGYIEQVFDNPIVATKIVGEIEVLANYESKVKKNELEPKARELKKLNKLLFKYDSEEERFQKMLARLSEAELIKNQLYSLDKEQKLAHLELDEHKIALDPKLNILENMQAMFKNAHKARRGLEHLEERRKKTMQDIHNASLEFLPLSETNTNSSKGKNLTTLHNAAEVARGKIPQALKKSAKQQKSLQFFRSSDGYLLVRGRNTDGNIQALKSAKAYDYWLHLASGTSAHLIIKRQNANDEVPARTFAEAGALVALKSPLKNESRAAIQFSLAKYIFPIKATKGLVRIERSEGSFMVDVNAELETKLLEDFKE